MCYMEIEDYDRCLNMFNLALNDIEETKFMPRLIIKYNIALSHENSDELETAEEEYNVLLKDTPCDSNSYLFQIENYQTSHGKNLEAAISDLLLKLTAACHRQLGWIEYRRTYKDEEKRDEHLKKAQDQLTHANVIDSRDGQNYYYLGRVYGEQDVTNGQVASVSTHEGTSRGRKFGIVPNFYSGIKVNLIRHIRNAHEAFVNYRHSIDKREQNADTWCSIGALYQKQNQPMDALQAFICAIELNPKLTSAWTDLGELYEKNEQFQDALDCFKNAMKHDPVCPEPLKARIQFLEKELSMPIPTRPANQAPPFEKNIPCLKEAYEQPIPLELRNRQDAAYMKQFLNFQEREYLYDHAFWNLWVEFRTMEEDQPEEVYWDTPEPRPMEDLEIQVLELLRANEPALVKAEREVLECLETSEAVFKRNICEYFISDATREMPRVTEIMIQNLRDHGHLLESPRCYPYDFLPRVAFQNLPESFSLLSELYVSLDISAQEIMQMVSKRAILNNTYQPIFDDYAKLPVPPKEPKKVIATEEDVKTALERNERHPLLLKTPVLTIDNRKEAGSLELQRYLDNCTVACIRGLTGCLRLDLSLFSTKAVMETDGNQEIEVRTQYHIPPETNCDHASQPTWKCISEPTYTTVAKYAQYQSESFKHTLRNEAEKIKKHGGAGGRGPSPKRMKMSKQSHAPTPPKELKSIKFGTNIDLSDDTKWGKQINELSKLPAFCRLIAGSNMLSHLGHQILGMNTVQLFMKVPGCRTLAHQDGNHMATVNINIGPGDCEWFAVPYDYWGKMERLCEKNGIDYLKGSFWPILDNLLEEGIPVHRFTQKAGDMVYVNGGSIHWVQATGWCNNISWNVAPMNNNQLTMSIFSYEYNKLRLFKSQVPMQLLCWQLAKNVKFTNQLIYNNCKGVLIRSLAFCKMVHDFCVGHKKVIKTHARSPGEQSHFCMTCEVEVFSILFIKDISGKFHVFCVYCAKSQGLDDFIALQQFPFNDLVSIYEGMKFIPAVINNNNKQNFTA
ncbi:CRE-UTX-1 protein [Caenorhabditis remanei]|uniref:CRE-UTX-1 protein n=1 Tax=Caenorhabditis remanei TaxID=31234 RepID=E3MUE5_CAERE|nr:CRE-UTX-1 protein [Caenorhabditis remanei]